MAYNSFYGGRQGASFIIVKNFSTIQEMVENFKQGSNYKVVNYNEYVLISTEDRYSKDNGKIYRRGYEYSNDMGGAIYIGQISGAPGPAPYLELATIEEIEETYETAGNQNIYRKGEGKYSIEDGNLVPGKYEDNGEIKYNDEIKWAYCSFVEEELGVAKIGFLTPYPVIDFEANLVETHYKGPFTEKLDDGSHPYYSKWNISIPKGIKGESVNNLRVIKANSEIQSYEGQEDDIQKQREILVYDYYKYDNEENGEPVSIYLGDYNMIDDIIISDDGTFTLNYSHDDNYTRERLFKWIKSITLTEKGHFTVEYNQETDEQGRFTKYETDLKWVDDIEIAEDGTVNISYSIENEEKSLNNLFKWIKNVTLTETGKFIVEYNYETDKEGQPTKYETELQWVNNVSMSDSGEIIIYYPNGTTKILENKIKWIDDIYIETGDIEGEGSQKLTIDYNNGDVVTIGKPLNYIIKTVVSDDYHLLALHSDPEKRAEIIAAGQNFIFEGRNDWQDLGIIKDENGILLGITYNTDDHPEMEDIFGAISALNQLHPNGLEGPDLKGKLITVGRALEDKSIYAFDYSFNSDGKYKGWYFLGSIGEGGNGGAGLVIGREGDSETETYAKALPVRGAWFVVE